MECMLNITYTFFSIFYNLKLGICYGKAIAKIGKLMFSLLCSNNSLIFIVFVVVVKERVLL